jgi:hypothetical protein
MAAARLLARTLDMPQHPDSMMITDANGKMHYSGIVGSEAVNEGSLWRPSRNRWSAAHDPGFAQPKPQLR